MPHTPRPRPPRRQAREHPPHGRGRGRARVPHRFRPHKAPRRHDCRGDPHGQLGRHPRLRRARADPGARDRRPHRRLLARVRRHELLRRPSTDGEGTALSRPVGPRRGPSALAVRLPLRAAAGLRLVIACATAKGPEQRFPSAGALAQRLAEAVALQLGGETETARPPPPDAATVDPRTATPAQPTGPVERAATTQRSPEPEPTVVRRVHPEVAPTLTSRAAPPAGGDAVPVTDSFSAPHAPARTRRRTPGGRGCCSSASARPLRRNAPPSGVGGEHDEPDPPGSDHRFSRCPQPGGPPVRLDRRAVRCRQAAVARQAWIRRGGTEPQGPC